jgi:hypothetical protein
MQPRDKDKLTKAGFATPRGGRKGAYQNHVLRSNRVVVPFERRAEVTVGNYKNGYVIRLFPEQYFAASGAPKPEFLGAAAGIRVGENAFVLYRSRESYEKFPPHKDWRIRGLECEGSEVDERGKDVIDVGHYVTRIPAVNDEREAIEEGPPQGIFAPEYADDETNFICKCALAWLIVSCTDCPYTTAHAEHLRRILEAAGALDHAGWERKGVTRAGITSCPLCLRYLEYEELHQMLSFSDEAGLINAAEQVAGATRSTVVNLFHMLPLTYSAIEHIPANIAWGHAVCNTRLGQRACHSLADVMAEGLKVGVITGTGIDTFGWITKDFQMIRSPRGAVWIRLHSDMSDEEWQGKPSAPEPDAPAIVDRSIAQ